MFPDNLCSFPMPVNLCKYLTSRAASLQLSTNAPQAVALHSCCSLAGFPLVFVPFSAGSPPLFSFIQVRSHMGKFIQFKGLVPSACAVVVNAA